MILMGHTPLWALIPPSTWQLDLVDRAHSVTEGTSRKTPALQIHHIDDMRHAKVKGKPSKQVSKLCLARHSRTNTVWFHLQEISRMRQIHGDDRLERGGQGEGRTGWLLIGVGFLCGLRRMFWNQRMAMIAYHEHTYRHWTVCFPPPRHHPVWRSFLSLFF